MRQAQQLIGVKEARWPGAHASVARGWCTGRTAAACLRAQFSGSGFKAPHPPPPSASTTFALLALPTRTHTLPRQPPSRSSEPPGHQDGDGSATHSSATPMADKVRTRTPMSPDARGACLLVPSLLSPGFLCAMSPCWCFLACVRWALGLFSVGTFVSCWTGDELKLCDLCVVCAVFLSRFFSPPFPARSFQIRGHWVFG